MQNITVLQKEFTVGWDFIQSGLPLKMWKEAQERQKWSFWKLFLYSIEGILAYSTAPLAVASVFGIVFCGVSFISMLVIIIRALAFGDPVAGWPSLVTIIFFLGGIQLLCLGIMGLYLSKTYLETKKETYLYCERKVSKK